MRPPWEGGLQVTDSLSGSVNSVGESVIKMDVGSAIRVLLRRWLVVLFGVLLTVGAAGYLYLNTPPSYTAGGRMLLLLPSNARGEDFVGSPFLYLPNELNVIGQVISVFPNSHDFQAAKAEAGLQSTVDVAVERQSPTLTLTVTGGDPEDVIKTRDWLVEQLSNELRRIQVEEGAPKAQTAHARVFAAEDQPVEESGSWMRQVIAAVGVGGLATLVVAFLIDYLLQRRKPRREAAKEAGSDGPAPSDDTDNAEESAEAGADLQAARAE